MIDVSGKAVTVRQAVATGTVSCSREVLDAVMSGNLPKGEALATARIAGIMGAKRTSELIPLCHPIPLDSAEITISRKSADSIEIRCLVRTAARTGVEMEALTGVSVAALSIYDMIKGVERGAVIGPIQLESKEGGRTGAWHRTPK